MACSLLLFNVARRSSLLLNGLMMPPLIFRPDSVVELVSAGASSSFSSSTSSSSSFLKAKKAFIKLCGAARRSGAKLVCFIARYCITISRKFLLLTLENPFYKCYSQKIGLSLPHSEEIKSQVQNFFKLLFVIRYINDQNVTHN